MTFLNLVPFFPFVPESTDRPLDVYSKSSLLNSFPHSISSPTNPSLTPLLYETSLCHVYNPLLLRNLMWFPLKFNSLNPVCLYKCTFSPTQYGLSASQCPWEQGCHIHLTDVWAPQAPGYSCTAPCAWSLQSKRRWLRTDRCTVCIMKRDEVRWSAMYSTLLTYADEVGLT